MAFLKCAACGGVYKDVGPDGVRYFHQCAPVLDPKTGARGVRSDARNENVFAVGPDAGKPIAPGKGTIAPSPDEVAKVNPAPVVVVVPDTAPAAAAPAADSSGGSPTSSDGVASPSNP